jgi:GntR family transcriptional regulator
LAAAGIEVGVLSSGPGSTDQAETGVRGFADPANHRTARRAGVPTAAAIIDLDRDSHVAMHRQIANRLRDAIAGSVYKPGEKIPTEPVLTRQFGVSRITVRQAIDALKREGLVIRKQGKGTFVTVPTVHYDLLELRGIYDDLVAQGHDPQTRLLAFSHAVPPARIAHRLGTGQRKLLSWRRLYEVRNKPFAVADVFLDTGRMRLSREDVDRNPTYRLLENLMQERIERADVSICYVRANASLAQILQLPRGAPLMLLERVSYNDQGVPREHSAYYARAEAYEFSLTVRGKLPMTSALRAAR